jgi:sugar O-acyltransferase (sialic acid O-acetyltransferase NeuD family)
MPDLLLFPFNGNSREALAALPPTYRLLGFLDDDPARHGQSFGGYSVLGGREELRKHPGAALLAVPGRPETFRQRHQIIAALELPPERWARVIHPTVQIGPECQVGYNTLIMAGVVLTAGVRVGNHCVILPNTVIAHESRLGDFSLVGSNVSISGGVQVDEGCYIGSGAKLIQEIHVGSRALVGLGAVVIDSVAAGSTVVGNPARKIREN